MRKRKVDFSLQGTSELDRLFVDELVNPKFNASSRRRHSIINAEYRPLLDPFSHLTYPLNCIGTFARIPPDYLESFVNIGKLLKIIKVRTTRQKLRILLATSDMVELRLSLRRAIHIIGDLSYGFEWVDVSTYSKIDTLLEGMATYTSRNRHVANSLREQLLRTYQTNEEVVLLDFGSGVGGTILEVLSALEVMADDGQVPPDYLSKTRVLLFDVSDVQLQTAQTEILKRFNIKKIELIQSNFRDIGGTLRNYVGRINIVVSGASICHVTQKDLFFSELYQLMKAGGAASIWDPAISQYQGHSIRMGQGKSIKVYFVTSGNGEYSARKGELLDIKTIEELSDTEYSTIADIPQEEMEIFVAMQRLHLFQMGFFGTDIGEKAATALYEKLYRDIFAQAQTTEGFNLIRWYEKNLTLGDLGDHALRLGRESWTPYDLIEAVEDKSSYEDYIVRARFDLVSSKRFSEIFGSHKPEDLVTAHYLFIKPE